MCGEHRGSRAQWLPEPLPECASPLWSPPWERSVQPSETRTSNALPLIEGRNRSPSVFYCALITRTPEDGCPAVHPNAGPLSQMTSQVLGRDHGLPSCLSICVTYEAQSPSPVLHSSVLTPWLCALLTTLGSVHCFPLWHGATWAVHSLWVPWLASEVAVRTRYSPKCLECHRRSGKVNGKCSFSLEKQTPSTKAQRPQVPGWCRHNSIHRGLVCSPGCFRKAHEAGVMGAHYESPKGLEKYSPDAANLG